MLHHKYLQQSLTSSISKTVYFFFTGIVVASDEFHFKTYFRDCYKILLDNFLNIFLYKNVKT